MEKRVRDGAVFACRFVTSLHRSLYICYTRAVTARYHRTKVKIARRWDKWHVVHSRGALLTDARRKIARRYTYQKYEIPKLAARNAI